MKVIVPCCGYSSRFPGQPPKWMLPAHDGRPMICHAVSGVEMDIDDLVVTILAEHETKFGVTAGLEKAFGRPIQVVSLTERTSSQAETVARTIQALKLKERFLVKDSDGVFTLRNPAADENYVCVDSLNNFDSINPRNKSYLQVDQRGAVINIREKVVISDLFNVGGYHFTDPVVFLEYYERLSQDKAQWNREIYLSDVIGAMILAGIPFRAQTTTGYHDWGTVKEWRHALLAQKTFFVLLDGFVFERGSPYFRPGFAEAQPHPAAVECLRSLATEGHQIIYLSIRPSELEELTRSQLSSAGLPPGQILWSCPIAKWVLLTAPHATMPFVTSQSLELRPDDPNLMETIQGELSFR